LFCRPLTTSIADANGGPEGIWFADNPEQPGVLGGSSKLFRGGGGIEWDDDSFLVWRDVQFIISHLAHWASRFGLVWCFSYEGGELGRVDATGMDHEVSNALSLLLASTPYATTDPFAVETTAAALLKKYTDLGLWP
jgi:hypothetical protein